MNVVLHEFEPTPDPAYLVNTRMAEIYEEKSGLTEKRRKAARTKPAPPRPIETEAA